VPPVEPTGRPIVLRANRVAAASLWAAAVGFVVVAAAACVALLATGNRETPVVIGLVAVAVLVSVRIHLRPGRLVDVRLDQATCRVRRVGRSDTVVARGAGVEAVLWLRRRYENAADPVVGGVYLVRGEEVILFTRAPTLGADRIRRFFAAGGMALRVTESADPPLERIDPGQRQS
jgi:hypothetical protein